MYRFFSEIIRAFLIHSYFGIAMFRFLASIFLTIHFVTSLLMVLGNEEEAEQSINDILNLPPGFDINSLAEILSPGVLPSGIKLSDLDLMPHLFDGRNLLDLYPEELDDVVRRAVTTYQGGTTVPRSLSTTTPIIVTQASTIPFERSVNEILNLPPGFDINSLAEILSPGVLPSGIKLSDLDLKPHLFEGRNLLDLYPEELDDVVRRAVTTYQGGTTIPRSLSSTTPIIVTQASTIPSDESEGVSTATPLYASTYVSSTSETFCTCGICPDSGNNCWEARLKIYFTDASYEPYFCGGTLIDSLYILAGAHCVSFANKSVDYVSVKFGIKDLNNTFDVQEFESREFYPNKDNEIAVIKLKSPVQIDPESKIRPICLPSSNSVSTSGS